MAGRWLKKCGAANGTGELVLPLTDAVGWDLPEYYTTLRLMNLPGRHGKVLAGRGASGLLLYGLTRGSGPVTAFPAGTWTQLAPGGPFANADCFSNLKCWDSAPYYQTIRFGDIDGEPGDEVIGWGGDGGVAFKWNGSEWVSLTGFPPGTMARGSQHVGDPVANQAQFDAQSAYVVLAGKPCTTWVLTSKADRSGST